MRGFFQIECYTSICYVSTETINLFLNIQQLPIKKSIQQTLSYRIMLVYLPLIDYVFCCYALTIGISTPLLGGRPKGCYLGPMLIGHVPCHVTVLVMWLTNERQASEKCEFTLVRDI